MRIIRKAISIAVCCMSLQALGAEKLSVPELLDRYAANQDKLKSFIAKTEVVTTRSPQDASTQQETKQRHVVEFRYEDSGTGLGVYYNITSFNSSSDRIWVPQGRSKTWLWDGQRSYEYYRAPDLSASTLRIRSDAEYTIEGIPVLYDGAGPILGILYGDADRLDSILKQSNTISVRDDLERVGSVGCYVIDMKSEHGSYTVWLDPEHGYGIAKAVVRKGSEDLLFGQPPSSYSDFESYKGQSFFMGNVRFENIKGVWIPMDADYGVTDSIGSQHTHSKRAHIDIDPNHAELQSFALDVQNGTTVRVVDGFGINYTWQNGEIVDMTGQPYSLDDIFNLPKLEGKVLPPLDNFDPEPPKEHLRNKPILVCFWDMDRCPSSVHYVLGLKEKQAILADKNVFVFLIHAGVVQHEILEAWLEGRKIPFICGVIQGEANKTLQRWYVRGLPWPILTDSKHIVRAEGLRLRELEEKIEQVSQTPNSEPRHEPQATKNESSR